MRIVELHWHARECVVKKDGVPLTVLRPLPYMRVCLRGYWASLSPLSLAVISVLIFVIQIMNASSLFGRFGRPDIPATVDYLQSFNGRTQCWVSASTQIQKLSLQIDPPVTLPPGLALPGWSEPSYGGKLEGLVFVWEWASPR